jgi:integrase/recombinase XerD
MYFQNTKTMKPTDFSKYISAFISDYLVNEKGASANTITAYRDTFVLLLSFIRDIKRIKPEKLTLDKIKKETVIDFLNWLQKIRGCSHSTRNARLAAVHSFYRFLQDQNLSYFHECQRILSIKSKKSPKETITYLSVEGMRLMLRQPNVKTQKGRRDLALLSLMYNTGARVQEIIDLTPSMLRLTKPAIIKIIGKGKKARLVPMLDMQVDLLKNYLQKNHLNEPEAGSYPLFSNSRKEKLTRAGINHIVQKYFQMAHLEDKTIVPEKISCHSFRHSKAMHLLQAGVNLVYIRDILGHVSVQTTEVYARADSRQKRKALENAYVNVNPSEEPQWLKSENLISWLQRL